jgi:hypothetical protein
LIVTSNYSNLTVQRKLIQARLEKYKSGSLLVELGYNPVTKKKGRIMLEFTTTKRLADLKKKTQMKLSWYRQFIREKST